MKFLPRSRRGTWLLAGAAWLAGCAGLWWWLPIVPRSWGPPGSNYVVGYLNDGKTLLTCTCHLDGHNLSIAGPIRQWNLDTEELTAEWLTPNERGLWAGLSPGRDWIAILSSPELPASTRQLRLIDAATGRQDMVFPLAGPSQWAISPDGKWLFYSDAEVHRSIVWDLKGCWPVLNLTERFAQAVFTQDSSVLITITSPPQSDSSKIQALKVPSGERLFEATIPQQLAYVRDFSPDGAWLLVGGAPNSEVRVLDIHTGREHLSARGNAMRAAFSADSQRLITIQKSEPADSWHLGSLDLLSREQVKLCDLDPNSSDNWFWSAPSVGRYFVVRSRHTRFPSAIDRWLSRFPWIGSRSPPSETLTFQLIDIDGWRETARWTSESEMQMLISPSGDSAAIASRDGIVQIWDIPPRKSLTWLAVGAAFLALPIVMLARRRVRKLTAA